MQQYLDTVVHETTSVNYDNTAGKSGFGDALDYLKENLTREKILDAFEAFFNLGADTISRSLDHMVNSLNNEDAQSRQGGYFDGLKESIGHSFAIIKLILSKLELEDIKALIGKVDSSAVMKKISQKLCAIDWTKLPFKLNGKTIKILKVVVEEVFKHLPELTENANSQEVIKQIYKNVSELGLPPEAAKALLKVIVHLAKTFANDLPKLLSTMSNKGLFSTIMSTPTLLWRFLTSMGSLKNLYSVISELDTRLEEFADDETSESNDDAENDTDTSSAELSTEGDEDTNTTESDDNSDAEAENDSSANDDIEKIDELLIETLNETNSSDDHSKVMEGLSEYHSLMAEVGFKKIDESEFIFETWKSLDTSDCKDFPSFLETVTSTLAKRQPSRPNALIHIDIDRIADFNIQCMRTLKAQGRQHFFIDDLEDISLNILVANGKTGTTSRSALGKFIDNAKPGDVIVVNIAKHARGLNGFDTDKRQLLSENIPDGVQVIILAPHDKQLDDDIYGRCGVHTNYEIPERVSIDDFYISEAPNPEMHCPKICFYHDDKGWKPEGVGTLHLEGERMSFIKKTIANAIDAQKPSVHMTNLPTSPDFWLWLETIISKNKIFYNGQWHHFPEGFKFYITEEPYEFKDINSTFIRYDHSVHANYDYSLNATSFNQFFKRLKTQDKKFYRLLGWLHLHEKDDDQKPIRIFVNSALTRAQWARFLDTAKRLKLMDRLQFFVLHDAYLPAELQVQITEDSKLSEKNNIDDLPKEASQRVDIITSDNPQQCFERLSKTHKIDYDFPLTDETQFPDIIAYLECKKVNDTFEATTKTTHIWKALQQNKTVALIGPLSPTLRAKLSTLLSKEKPDCCVNSKSTALKGRLMIFTTPQHRVEYAVNTYHDSTPATPTPPPLKVHVKNSDEIEDIQQARYEAVKPVFDAGPGACLMGKYGVGKSVFIRKVFAEYAIKNGDGPVHVFVGEKEKKAWRECKKKGLKILARDEFNLQPKGHWDDDISMASVNTPTAKVDHEFEPITKDHKIAYLGNFNSDEGREEHAFIAKHVPHIHLHEFSDKFLKAKVIPPIIDAALRKDADPAVYKAAKQHIDMLAAAYNEIKSLVNDKPISARNLAMMTVRFIANIDLTKTENVEAHIQEALALAIYYEADTLLEQKQVRKVFKNIKPEYPKDANILSPEEILIKEKMQANGYTLTYTHYPLFKHILAMLSIHERAVHNLELRKFMMRALSIEGISGAGKTSLLRNVFLAKGYRDAIADSQAPFYVRMTRAIKTLFGYGPPSYKKFYHITATSIKAFERTIDHATDDDAIAFTDEFNTLPLESEKLNDALTGLNTSALQFYVAQNPISLGGRNPLSEPMQSRFVNLFMGDRPDHELIKTINNLGPGAEQFSARLVKGYRKAQDIAEKNFYHPAPNPRDLYRRAKTILKKYFTPSKKVKTISWLAKWYPTLLIAFCLISSFVTILLSQGTLLPLVYFPMLAEIPMPVAALLTTIGTVALTYGYYLTMQLVVQYAISPILGWGFWKTLSWYTAGASDQVRDVMDSLEKTVSSETKPPPPIVNALTKDLDLPKIVNIPQFGNNELSESTSSRNNFIPE